MIKVNEEFEKVLNKYRHQAAYSGELTLNGNTDLKIDLPHTELLINR